MKFLTVLLLSFGIYPSLLAQESFVDFEAEKMVLFNYSIDSVNEAYGKALIRLDGDFGSATLKRGSSAAYYDLQVTYIKEDGDYAFEIYIDDELVDAWKSDENTGFYKEDVLNRVSHLTQNAKITGDIEIVAYASNGESCKIDKVSLRKANIDENECNMTWSTGNAINSLYLGGKERIGSGSGFHINEFSGSKINSLSQIVKGIAGQVCVFTDSYGFAQVKYRVEHYDYHVRIKMIGLECMPENDKSLCPVLSIPCSSAVGYDVLDGNIEVVKSGNNLTLYWNKLAEHGLTPGGYIALYAANEATKAKNEMAALEVLEPPFLSTAPTNIFLAPSEITENNNIGDVVGVLTASDPEGDIAYYSLTAGEGDDDNNSFLLVLDKLEAKKVFDYNTDSLYSVRIKVTDSQQNTYSKAFTIKILKDYTSAVKNVFANSEVNIYPNPASNVFYIETNETCSIQITNIEGRSMYFGEHLDHKSVVDIKSFPPGLYFVRLFNNQEQTIQKIVKK